MVVDIDNNNEADGNNREKEGGVQGIKKFLIPVADTAPVTNNQPIDSHISSIFDKVAKALDISIDCIGVASASGVRRSVDSTTFLLFGLQCTSKI